MWNQRLAVELALLALAVRSGQQLWDGQPFTEAVERCLWTAATAYVLGTGVGWVLSRLAAESGQRRSDQHREPIQQQPEPTALSV